MSGNGMGGQEYDDIVEALTSLPHTVDVILAPSDKMEQLHNQLNSQANYSKDVSGFAGYFVGIAVWIDDRFDEMYFLSGQ